MKTVTIYTDGACSGNPGPGGWGAILMYGPHSRELSGGEAATTNNRMELTAVIQALSLLKEPCIVDLWSDSKYVIDGLEKGWAKGWKARGWKKADKKPALNPDLWDRPSVTIGSRATRRMRTTTAVMSWRWRRARNTSSMSSVPRRTGQAPYKRFDDGKATAESEFPPAGQIKKIGPPPALPGEGPCGERIQQPL